MKLTIKFCQEGPEQIAVESDEYPGMVGRGISRVEAMADLLVQLEKEWLNEVDG